MRMSQTVHGTLVPFHRIDLRVRFPLLVSGRNARLEAAAHARTKARCLEIHANPLRSLPKHEVPPFVGGVEKLADPIAVVTKLGFDTSAHHGRMAG